MKNNKLTNKEIQDYILSRSEEALKEIIVKDQMLKDNKVFREVFRAGFYSGMNVQAKILQDIGKEVCE